MSYRDIEIYSDVVDVLDNIHDNVDSYLAVMHDEDAQTTAEVESEFNNNNNNSSSGSHGDDAVGHVLKSAAAAASGVNAPCRLYIKENGPVVMRLSESVQVLLENVVAQQRQEMASATQPGQRGSAAAAGPTPEAARNEAVRALVTRKLGDVMENAHAMRSVVKQQQQQQQQRTSRRPGPPSLPRPIGDGAVSSHDLRMKQLLRVISHDLEDTERLLRIAFPDAAAATASTSPPLPPSRGPGGLPQRLSGSGPRSLPSSDTFTSPDRPSINTIGMSSGVYSASSTPRNSSSTAPYVRRSESLDTSGLPRQASPGGPLNYDDSNNNSTSSTSRRAAAVAGRIEDEVLHSPDASSRSSVLSTSQPGGAAKSTTPRVRFALDRDDEEDRNSARDGENGQDSQDNSTQSLLQEALDNDDRIRVSSGGGLTSNRVRQRSNSNSVSSNAEGSNRSSTANNNSKAAASVSQRLTSVLGGMMQLAPFTLRRPSLTADAADSSTTVSEKEATQQSASTSISDPNVPHAAGAAARVRSPAPSTASSTSMPVGTATVAYDPAKQIFAHAEAPRGILKTSSSRIGSASNNAEGSGGSNNNNNSTSRSSAFSTPNASRLVVQFADDVDDYPSQAMSGDNNSANDNSSNGGRGGSENAAEPSSDSGGSSGSTSNTYSHSQTQNPSTSISSFTGNGNRARGLPPGLPPRSPRQPDTLGLALPLPTGQRPPLAPTPSTSISFTSFKAPSRNVWVTTAHSQRLPGELWGSILQERRAEMEHVLRDDVIDLFNYGEAEPLLQRDDVSDISFRVVDTHLYMRFELEHQRSLTESEINLRLGLCSYPLMTALYEEYFQEYQAKEFDPIEGSSNTLSNLTTPVHGSTRLSHSLSTPSYREGTMEPVDVQPRVAPLHAMALAIPQPVSPHSHDVGGALHLVSPLSMQSENTDSRTLSAVGEPGKSYPFTPHAGALAGTSPSAGGVASPPDNAVTPTGSAKVARGKSDAGPLSSSPKSSSLLSTGPATAAATDRAQHMTSGTTTPSTICTPVAAAAAAARRQNARRTKEESLMAAASTPSSGSGSTSSLFAVAVRQRDGAGTPTSATSSSSAAAASPSAPGSPVHAHTLRLPGAHWEAVTTRVPEDVLKDAFLSDVSLALGVLPSEARNTCQRVRFYLGSLVVKFRWNNAELYPGAAPLSAADVDTKLEDYNFPALRLVYAESCAALNLVNDLAVSEARERALNAEASLSSMPEAQFTLPMKAELDHLSGEEPTPREQSTTKDSADMQHRGEGAPSRSPSTSMNVMPANNNNNNRNEGVQGRRSASTPTGQTVEATVTELKSAHVDTSPSPRLTSPDPAPAVSKPKASVLRSGSAHSLDSAEESEPRETTPVAAQAPTTQPRTRTAAAAPQLQPRRSHSPLAPPSLQSRHDRGRGSGENTAAVAGNSSSSGAGGGTNVVTVASSLKNHRDSRSRSADSPRHRGSTPPPPVARRGGSAVAPRQATTTLNRLARHHHVALAQLLEANPSLAQHDPDKIIPMPEPLALPHTPASPTTTTTTTAVTRTAPAADKEKKPAEAAATTAKVEAAPQQPSRTAPVPTNASSAALTSAPAEASSVVPRSISARRRGEGGIVASLRTRPRLTPKEKDTSADHESQPTSTHTPPAADGAAAAAVVKTPAPAAKSEDSVRRAATSRTAVPPPLSAADVEVRGAPRKAAPPSVVVATPRQPSSPERHQPEAVPPSAPAHTQEKVKSSSDKATSSIARVREASPRTPQAAASADAPAMLSPSEAPAHQVYQLPPQTASAEVPALPIDKAAPAAEFASVSRSARRQHRPHLDAASTGHAAGHAAHHSISRSSHTNAHGSDDAGDSDSRSVSAVEQELGIRLRHLTVEGVRKKGVAAEAGVQVGDVLRTLDGQILTSEQDLYRGLVASQQRSDEEQTSFVTAVSARGAPVTYRLRLPPSTGADPLSGRRPVASTARQPVSSPSPPPAAPTAAAAAAAAARHALLSPPARQQIPSQSARSPRGVRQHVTPSTTTTTHATSTTTTSSASPAPPPATTRILRGEAAMATPAARTRVSSIGAAAREAHQPRRSHSNHVLRETEAPATVHVNASGSSAAGSVVAASLSARRTGRANVSVSRVREQPK